MKTTGNFYYGSAWLGVFALRFTLHHRPLSREGLQSALTPHAGGGAVGRVPRPSRQGLPMV
jgi:hypothetical protein